VIKSPVLRKQNEAQAEEEQPDEDTIEDEVDAVACFVETCVRESVPQITHKFRWNSDADNKLQTELIRKKLSITVEDMKARIKAYVLPSK